MNNPNLKQQIFIKAVEAAQTVPLELDDHSLATAQLNTFNAQGLDPADFPDWCQVFAQNRSILTQRGTQKTKSEELAAAKPKAAAAS